MGRIVAMLSLAAMGVVLLMATTGLPEFGNPKVPPSRHLSDQMLEGAYHDAHTPNVVTVMIGDYRSFDTLGEGIVVFTAGLACFLLLRSERRRDQEEPDA